MVGEGLLYAKVGFAVKKVVYFPDALGLCIVPVCSEEQMHEFGLFDEVGKRLRTGYFCSMERALERKQEEFPGSNYSVKDLDEEWYVEKAQQYRGRIKELHPAFRKSEIILDMSELYYGRTPENWYTYIPFFYNGQRWVYRESAREDWIEK